ncbi:ubiquitin-conjugating enzyme E2 [Trypanosoma conorhini]|uniref:Ubiquitin-conjugating enzyme E2 n=1 Tax=Trypanosoma conorhini TaxID=83891 RepID=A0A422P0F9_9TRYP|nr:ubiquitin-conjugating enzyme E2 [Trypanosoma conorhini]RNF11233.1 ubiquitin-conjugating enzyme E2 [Trypanosoma conorhini]
MKNIAAKRISKDLRLLLEDVTASSEGKNRCVTQSAVIIAVDVENVYSWVLKAKAPAASVYGGADRVYELTVLFSVDYPHDPPTVRFLTPIYSPLVTKEGVICDQMVRINWTPDMQASDAVRLVLDRVFSQYNKHHEDDVYPEARHCLENCPEDYAERVRRGR